MLSSTLMWENTIILEWLDNSRKGYPWTGAGEGCYYDNSRWDSIINTTNIISALLSNSPVPSTVLTSSEIMVCVNRVAVVVSLHP